MSNEIVQQGNSLSSQIAGIACNYNVPDFVQGQKDCRDGVPHKDGNGESYDAGFRCEYELSAIQSRGFN